jgi:hypothetical protein
MLGGTMDIGHAILSTLGYLLAVLFFSLLGGAVCRSVKSAATTNRRRDADIPLDRSGPTTRQAAGSGNRGAGGGVVTEDYDIF